MHLSRAKHTFRWFLEYMKSTTESSVFRHLCATVLCFSWNVNTISLRDERGKRISERTVTVDGVPGASCGEGKTHVVLLAAFTAGLKVKDSHRGDARPILESGRFPFFLYKPRAFLIPSSFTKQLGPTWSFTAPPWLRPPSTPSEPFWRRECKLWSLPLANVSWLLPAYHWRRRRHQSLEATE